VRPRWLIAGVAVAVVLLVVALTAFGTSGRTSRGPASAAPAPSVAFSPSPSPSPSASPSPAPSPAASSPFGPSEPSRAPNPGGTATPSSAGGDVESLAALLARLRIAPEHRDGYQRSLFVHWIDADGDGCDTRREVLIAEAIVAPTVGARCSLTGGRWLSAYDGLIETDIAKIQIDHVVALAEAWDSGAYGWTAARRRAYANDLDVPWPLIAVSASSNQSKSDKDPTEWLPPASADECPYLSAWIATKARWDLAVDPAEHELLSADVSVDCPSATMPYVPEPGVPIPTPRPTGTPRPGGTPTGGCEPAYPSICIPPPPPDLDCGDIPYRNFTVLPPDPDRFDGDHDGIGCET
jgi:Protein of unknown function (DUF1524)